MELFVPALLAFCLVAILVLSFALARRHFIGPSAAVDTRKLDVSAKDLLHDLTTRGQAVVRVEVIDPASILLRSPRQ